MRTLGAEGLQLHCFGTGHLAVVLRIQNICNNSQARNPNSNISSFKFKQCYPRREVAGAHFWSLNSLSLVHSKKRSHSQATPSLKLQIPNPYKPALSGNLNNKEYPSLVVQKESPTQEGHTGISGGHRSP